jgi:hypothetical protein
MCRSVLVIESNEAEDSTYGTNKREHSPGTKKRIAQSNARHSDLQKQRNKELKEMIPEAFLEEAKNVQGSNRALIHTLNAAQLYIAKLLEDKEQMQEKLEKGHGQSADTDMDRDDEDKNAEGALLDGKSGYGRATYQGAKVGDDEGKLPMTLPADISPHDSLLRQAVERFIALTKDCVISTQGVLGKEQIDRLNIVHDFIVEMVDEMREG